VEIAVEGESDALHTFVADLQSEAPPLARIDRLAAEPAMASGWSGFAIVDSAATESVRQLVPPDVGICAECERELLDPSNRRYRYPFITCTDCGPRYSVIDAMPYDRARTSMRAFAQCRLCAAEYRDPGDRRYHSETNSCPECGPSLRGVGAHDVTLPSGDPIAVAARLIEAGQAVAIRGIGGFHLAVDATNERAVSRLRARKRRDGKPLAVMVRTVDDARQLAIVSEQEARWLASPERPIVILKARSESSVAPSVSVGLGTIGVMLAYTPLHILLVETVGRPLVMTSGNPSGQPLASTLDEATRTLGDIADAYLTHDREIVARVDDSVVRVAEPAPIVMRRGRGFAPIPVTLPIATSLPLVAVGPHLKNTFAVAIGDTAFLSPHIGDLETVETEEAWRAAYRALTRLFDVTPRVAVRDLHPGYVSTRIAESLPVERVVAVQHHHAHVAAVAAEHGITTPVIGVAFDGTGYGADGRTWGAEILVADLAQFHRAAHLRYLPLAGGDRAARSPWRSALGYEHLLGQKSLLTAEAIRSVPKDELDLVRRQLAAGLFTPLASSMGRFFDAAAAILGVCLESRFEGEAAMRLESLAGNRPGRLRWLDVGTEIDGSGARVLDPIPLLVYLADAVERGEDRADLAADFHSSVADATTRLVAAIAEREETRRVVLAGGVFQNARLTAELSAGLQQLALEVFLPRQLPANDGAISYGQAVVAAAKLEAGVD
jgi:hydrogenase maturation protein HypF